MRGSARAITGHLFAQRCRGVNSKTRSRSGSPGTGSVDGLRRRRPRNPLPLRDMDHGSVFEAFEALALSRSSEFSKPVGVKRSVRSRSACKLPKVLAIAKKESCGTGSPGRRTAEGPGLVDDGELDVSAVEEVSGQPVECLPGVRRHAAAESIGVDDVEVGWFAKFASSLVA